MSTIIDGDVEIGGDFAREGKEPVKLPVEVVEVAEETPEEAVEEAPEGAEEGTEEAPEEQPHKKLTAKERIQQLNREKRELERKMKEFEASAANDRLSRIEKLLTGEIKLRDDATSGNVNSSGAPDPNDLAKYPLGSLDDRFIKDLTRWEVQQEFRADQQRQLEDARMQAEQAAATELLKKADEVVQKGAEIYEDYREVVWEAGRRGDYDMSQPTFEAILEAEHGTDIAYALASDKVEAARVARLSPLKQIQYVATKNAEFEAKRKPKLPKAGSPPAYQARGASGKFDVDPATDDLGAFKRALFTR